MNTYLRRYAVVVHSDEKRKLVFTIDAFIIALLRSCNAGSVNFSDMPVGYKIARYSKSDKLPSASFVYVPGTQTQVPTYVRTTYSKIMVNY